MERNLEQITQLSRKLPTTEAPETRSIQLLSQKGLDSLKLHSTVNNLDLSHVFVPVAAPETADIETFLQRQYDEFVAEAIEDHRSFFLKMFEDEFDDALARDWEESKNKLGLSAHFELPSVQAPVSEYSKIVAKLNDSRIQGNPLLIVNEFLQVSLRDSSDAAIADCWRLLGHVLNEEKDQTPLKLAKGYRDFSFDGEPGEETIQVNKEIVAGSLSYLEQHFYKYIQDLVRQHHAVVGGIPTVHSIVESYIRIRFKRYNEWSVPYLSTPNGKAIFAHVYYLIRSGHKQEAIEYVASSPEFDRFDPNFLDYLRLWVEYGELDKRVQENLTLYWNTTIRPLNVQDQKGNWCGGDPFRVALYKLFGRCEMHKKKVGVVNPSLEDYLWYHLNLVKETSSTLDHFDKYTLKDMASAILRFGKDYYNNGQTPLTYFKVLLLTGEFEKAIQYLRSTTSYSDEAIHFGVACLYYGALRLKRIGYDTVVEKTIATTGGDARKKTVVTYIDFVKMCLGSGYGLEYLYAIAIYDDCKPICLDILGEIILKGDIRKLIGYVHDGIPGEIQKYMQLLDLNTKTFPRFLAGVAAKARDSGHFDRSIMLFDAAGEYEQVLDSLESYLSESFVESYDRGNVAAPLPVQVTEDILKSYMESGISSSLSSLKQHNIGALITIHRFVLDTLAQRDTAALELLDSLELFPRVQDIQQVKTKCVDFESQSHAIKQCFGILVKRYAALLKRLYDRGGDVKQRVGSLVLFIANVKFKLSSDVYVLLNKLDLDVK